MSLRRSDLDDQFDEFCSSILDQCFDEIESLQCENSTLAFDYDDAQDRIKELEAKVVDLEKEIDLLRRGDA